MGATGSVPGPAAGSGSEAFGRAFGAGVAIGVAAGMTSGLVGFGPLGFAFGAFFGAMVAVVPALCGAAVIAKSFGRGPGAYRRCIDVVLGVFALAWLALSVAWVATDALIGDVAPVVSVVTVAIGLWFARRWLRDLAPVEAGRAF